MSLPRWQAGKGGATWRTWWSCLCVVVLVGVFGSRWSVTRDWSFDADRSYVSLLRGPATVTGEPQAEVREYAHQLTSLEGCERAAAAEEEVKRVDAATAMEVERLRLKVWQQGLVLERHGKTLRKLEKDVELWKNRTAAGSSSAEPLPPAFATDLLANYRVEARNLLRELTRVGKDVGACLQLGRVHNLTNVSVVDDGGRAGSGGGACVPEGVREAVQRVPVGVVQATSDLYLHSIHGMIDETESSRQPTNLLAMAVGIKQKENVNRMIQKFPAENFTLLLFHYDESAYADWNEFSWNSRAVHVQVPKQGKWWYAKRFLHPDIVAPYDYIFYFDEDMGLKHFDSLRYVEVMRKHGLEISQPALFPYYNVHFPLTRLVRGSEMHKRTSAGYNKNQTLCQGGSNEIPCAGFVEMMVPVFTRKAWKCVWHMIQNDLVLGWAMDFKFGACANGPPHEKIGIIDTDFVTHMSTQSLGEEGRPAGGKTMREKVLGRSWMEYDVFLERWAIAEKQAEGTSTGNNSSVRGGIHR